MAKLEDIVIFIGATIYMLKIRKIGANQHMQVPQG